MDITEYSVKTPTYPTKILIIEDELIVAENITRNLKKLGYEVLGIVDSGEEAIQTARKKHPNLV
ncbi:MAG: response regulator, partial [Okeania sp. SIO2H7]|nr:response regulator [Okeania sp. SIO2H7]